MRVGMYGFLAHIAGALLVAFAASGEVDGCVVPNLPFMADFLIGVILILVVVFGGAYLEERIVKSKRGDRKVVDIRERIR